MANRTLRYVIRNYIRYRKIRKRITTVYYNKLIKATLFISIVPIMAIFIFVLYERLSFTEGLVASIVVFVSSSFVAKPYLTDLTALTRYVEQLALDRKAETPPLSFLGNVEELSEAVKNLHHSWGERKIKLEAAIAESKILFDILPDILLMLDEDLKIVRANNAAFLALGTKIIHQKIQNIVPEQDLYRTIDLVVETGQEQQLEIQVQNQQIRRDYMVRIEKFPIYSAGGIATVVIMHDITEAKLTRQMMKDFVANASHEIRTPLTSIIGFIETLRTVAQDDKDAREKFLAIMAEQAEHLSVLVNDLLTLSKSEVKETTTPTDIVDISEVIKSAINRSHWAASKKKMNLKLDADAILPEITGDTVELAQVFTNLISNAIKYGQENTDIDIRAGAIDKNEPDNKKLPGTDANIYISIRNFGETIPQELIPRITERFFRIDKVRARKIGGAGLGLAIVKHILNRHHADMKIESDATTGTVFTVRLPVSLA